MNDPIQDYPYAEVQKNEYGWWNVTIHRTHLSALSTTCFTQWGARKTAAKELAKINRVNMNPVEVIR